MVKKANITVYKTVVYYVSSFKIFKFETFCARIIDEMNFGGDIVGSNKQRRRRRE